MKLFICLSAAVYLILEYCQVYGWTLCDIVPFHADKCLNMYKMGLGFNTMESREQKH